MQHLPLALMAGFRCPIWLFVSEEEEQEGSAGLHVVHIPSD